MEILRAIPNDADRIVELNRLFHIDIPNFKWDTPEWVLEETYKKSYFKGMEGDKLVSAMCLKTLKDRLCIEAIAVERLLHGKGIGKAMVNFAKNYAIEKDIRFLCVDSFQKYGLEKFYSSCGFRIVGTEIYEGHKYNQFSMQILNS
jgi:GNAT superfamily N-acetyltransferase